MRILKFFMIVCVALAVFGCQSKVRPVSVTFVQYNVGVFDKYDSSSIRSVADAVKELDADIVSLNEVDSCALRTGGVDQIALFALEMGGWNAFYASAMPFNGGAYGVGVVSSPEWKVKRADKIPLPRLNGYEPRVLSVVEYRDFVFASTHLDLTLDSQLGQVEVICHYMDSVYSGSGKPVFLAGDFNFEPDSEPAMLMKKSWIQLSPSDFSYPSASPRKCIDYIFVRPRGNIVTVVSAGVPHTLQNADLATASDHLPVVLKVKVE